MVKENGSGIVRIPAGTPPGQAAPGTPILPEGSGPDSGRDPVPRSAPDSRLETTPGRLQRVLQRGSSILRSAGSLCSR